LNENDRLCVDDFAGCDHRNCLLQRSLDDLDIFPLLLEPTTVGTLSAGE
jgi:hypothetical protein